MYMSSGKNSFAKTIDCIINISKAERSGSWRDESPEKGFAFSRIRSKAISGLQNINARYVLHNRLILTLRSTRDE
jgi:hypothetical protein